MKCTICARELEGLAIVLTLFGTLASYTATLHASCLESKIGVSNVRKIRNLAFDSGWEQTGLPELRQPHNQ